MCLCGGACAGGDGWRPRGGGQGGGGGREGSTAGKVQVRRVVLFPAPTRCWLGSPYPTRTRPTPALFSLPFLSSSKSCGRRAKGTDDSTLVGKRGNPILSARHPGPSKSIAFVPVSLLEAAFSICSSKFASFNPSPSLVPLPSYDSLTLSAGHTASTRGERERPEREDSFVRWPSPFPREGDGLFQTV